MKVKEAFKNFSERFSRKGENYGYLLTKGKLKSEIERAVLALNAANIEFDTIAVQGVSGLLFGAPLAAALDKGLIIVRRPGDESALTFPFGIKGQKTNQNILFVDDCVLTGATSKRVIEKLDDFCQPYTLAGALFYNVGWQAGNYPKTFYHNGAECPVIVLPDDTPPILSPIVNPVATAILNSIPGGESFTK
ncbi:MAG TPA: phosphoribosyltransferase [Pyrinomonadaceae bacterium]|jgi:hypoxanthine phosphoribosyltransferase